MISLHVEPDALAHAAALLDGKGPVHMVNLLRYRERADYGNAASAPQACSGREAYFTRYLPAFQRAATGVTFSVAWLGNVHATLVGALGEAWDDVAIVQYESFAALRRILESPVYRLEADQHRRAALADWRFLAATKMEMP